MLQALKSRVESGSKPGARSDGQKIALCIEGGGMRGAVSAGMTAALRYCGAHDAFDAVYGCSAGSIVGAYFVSNQLPVFGARIYYDVICRPHRQGPFVDLRALRHHPYLRLPFSRGGGGGRGRGAALTEAAVAIEAAAAVEAVSAGADTASTETVSGVGTRRRAGRVGRPVLMLDRLIDEVMRDVAPLDWRAFSTRHAHQPLIPVATTLSAQRSRAFRDIASLDGLLERLRASACVLGIAGEAVRIDGEVFADGLFTEPIPYRSAVAHGATHVLVLRTRASGSRLPARAGVYERWVARPALARTQALTGWRGMASYLQRGRHIAVYHEDAARLEAASTDATPWGGAHLLSVEPRMGRTRVSQLEGKARVVFEGVREGFAAGYDVVSEFAGFVGTAEGEEGMTAGDRVARMVFPDEEIERVEEEHRNMRRRWREDDRESRAARSGGRRWYRPWRRRKAQGKGKDGEDGDGADGDGDGADESGKVVLGTASVEELFIS